MYRNYKRTKPTDRKWTPDDFMFGTEDKRREQETRATLEALRAMAKPKQKD